MRLPALPVQPQESDQPNISNSQLHHFSSVPNLSLLNCCTSITMHLAAITLREVACLACPFSSKVFVKGAGIPNISSSYSFSSLLDVIDQVQSSHLDVALFVRNYTNIRAHSMSAERWYEPPSTTQIGNTDRYQPPMFERTMLASRVKLWTLFSNGGICKNVI